MKTNPLRWRFEDRRENGDRVDYFRHNDGRCVASINARPEMVGHEDGSPYPVIEFESLEVDGRRIDRDDADTLDELSNIVRDALRGFEWEARPSNGLIL